MRLSDFLRSIGDIVYYYPALSPVCGGCKPTILLCRLIQWHGHQSDPDGRIHKTQTDICSETGMTDDEQIGARKVLKDRGIISEEYKRIEHRLYFTINFDHLNDLWEEHLLQNPQLLPDVLPQNGISGLGKPEKQVSGKLKKGFGQTGKVVVAKTGKRSSPKPDSLPRHDRKTGFVPVNNKLTSHSAAQEGAAAVFGKLIEVEGIDQDWACRVAASTPLTYATSMVERCLIEGHTPGWLREAIVAGNWHPFKAKPCPAGEREERTRRKAAGESKVAEVLAEVADIPHADYRKIGDELAALWGDEMSTWWTVNPTKTNYTYAEKILGRWKKANAL